MGIAGTGWVKTTVSSTGTPYNVQFSKGSGTYILCHDSSKTTSEIYKKVSGTWTEVWQSSSIYPSNWSLPVDMSTDGNYFIHTDLVGTTNSTINVYVKGSGDNWSIQQTLSMPFGACFSGIKINNDGTRIVTCSSSANSNNGIVYVWTRSGSTWTQTQTFTPPFQTSYSGQVNTGGKGFDISGDGIWLILSAGDFYYGGVIYFYKWGGSSYSLIQTINYTTDIASYGKLSTRNSDGYHGFNLNDDGTLATISSNYDSATLQGREKIFVLERNGNAWSVSKYLMMFNPTRWTSDGTATPNPGNIDLNNELSSGNSNYDGYKLGIGDSPIAMNASGNIIVSGGVRLNYSFYQTQGLAVWRF